MGYRNLRVPEVTTIATLGWSSDHETNALARALRAGTAMMEQARYYYWLLAGWKREKLEIGVVGTGGRWILLIPNPQNDLGGCDLSVKNKGPFCIFALYTSYAPRAHNKANLCCTTL